MRIRLAFYKAKFPDGDIFDNIISGWTGLFNWGTPPYSHGEIGFEIDGKWRYFSSSIRDGGTRWKDDVTKKHSERWDVYETDKFNDRAVTRMIERANSILDKGYDVLGILGFITITGQVLNNKNKWYCSEACYFALTGIWKKRVSPRRFYTIIKGSFEKETL